MKDDARATHSSLHEDMRNIIEETRVILPGIQTLFGFQTIVVFNERFAQLPEFAKVCHLVSLFTVIIAIALIVTPAVYYRYVGDDYVSPQMLVVSTRMIRIALFCLSIGLSLDIFTVIYTVTARIATSVIGAIIVFLLLIVMWFLFPLAARKAVRRDSRSR